MAVGTTIRRVRALRRVETRTAKAASTSGIQARKRFHSRNWKWPV